MQLDPLFTVHGFGSLPNSFNALPLQGFCLGAAIVNHTVKLLPLSLRAPAEEMCQGAELGMLSGLWAIQQPQKQPGMGCHPLKQPAVFLTWRAAENLEDVKMAQVFQRQTQGTPAQAAAGGPSCVQPVPARALQEQD